MVIPSSNVNYPLAVLAIFLRRVLDKLRRVPNSALLVKSHPSWFANIRALEEWPMVLFSFAVTYMISYIVRKPSNGLVNLARKKAMVAIKTSLRDKRWLEKRKVWLTRNLNEKKTREFQTHMSNSMFRKPDLISNHHRIKFSRPNVLSQLKTINMIKDLKDPALEQEQCDIIPELLQENNSHKTSSINTEDSNSCVDMSIFQPTKRALSTIKETDEEDERTQDSQNQKNEKEEKSKFLDTMCEMLPIIKSCNSGFSATEKDDENKTDLRNVINTSNANRKKKRRRKFFTVRKRLIRPGKNYGFLLKYPHVIRMTRSGKIYGYIDNRIHINNTNDVRSQ